MTSSALFVGDESLLVQCAQHWLDRGNAVAAVATQNPEIARWAEGAGLTVLAAGAELRRAVAGQGFDWLLSIANLSVLPSEVLAQARKGAVNFHDGPLPRHAGLNAPVWAILEGETEHGISWHLIEGGIDEGGVLVARRFPIAPDETALTLNTRCYEAAIESFPELAQALEHGTPISVPQDLSRRTLHRRDDRPAAAARQDVARPAAELWRMVRALDHGNYVNPLALPKIEAGGRVLVVGAAEPCSGSAEPGLVLSVDEAGLTVACAEGAITLRGLRTMDGAAVCQRTVAAVGDRLVLPTAAGSDALTRAIAAVTPGEGFWRARLRDFVPAEVPLARQPAEVPDWQSLTLAIPAEKHPAAVALWLAGLTGRSEADLAFVAGPPEARGYLSDWVPLRLTADPGATVASHVAAQEATLARSMRWPAFAADLPLRDPAIGPVAQPQIALAPGAGGPVAGTVLTLDGSTLHFDAARLSREAAQILAARLDHFATCLAEAEGTARLSDLPAMPETERRLVLDIWNRTETKVDPAPIHRAFEAQAARTPEATALIHEARTLSYGALDAAANRVAHVLRDMGVRPGVPVGLFLRRTPDLVIGALGILKAGGAYVPLDPAYPADRIALYLGDSAAPVIVTQADLADHLPETTAAVLALDADRRIDTASVAPLPDGAGPEDLAYLIYTSGSTGRPKGVMVEHRNVANFFAGMDARIGPDPGTWLAVTSLSFDISVLELFWTLTRGFRVVLMGDEDRALVSRGSVPGGRRMDFSLFYWGNDDGAGGRARYDLLLEGARFADSHGFCAVWTPERHFHAFGGPYPNPAVTGAAVAAVTRNLEVRAGSCVAPLHHPARIAEDWAVIDNLTGGRTALGIASGWHPEDFVLRPENGPPHNKRAMHESIERVRRLWRGEAVGFPLADGREVEVVTQPRPVSAEAKIFLTIAGNPDTWREAGEIGAHVLTHLLGQSIEELEGKIAIYHAALRAAGHDPADFSVALMLHTYVARDREAARRIAREPMKAYLRSAAALVRQYAWAFPAFKRPQGITDPSDIDLRRLAPEETEAILDFAFERYFEESGLFGTVDDCLARVEQLSRLGISEIACLIDYGIAKETVLEGLHPLAEVLRRANAAVGEAETDYSIAAQIQRHGVTHLQCTPSMARMILMNHEARAALPRIRQLMIGGEALPGGLVAELRSASPARVLNMYGPTETTIWSTVGEAEAVEAVANIGTPIANTVLRVLDPAGRPVPVGATGELWIGGAGVARGYWQRPDLTADRFRPDPFGTGRIYGTGDLVRWRGDGRLDFLGRADHQVKLRGYRIEPGEIEAAAETHPAVRQAVVLAREDAPGDPRLVAYVVADPPIQPAQLRDHLAGLLPPHMVPAHVVVLDTFPLTPNRKIDRKALPAPQEVLETPEQAYEAPAPGIQETIAAVWRQVLNVPRVGMQDNFFALGGHSLLAVQAHRDLCAAFGDGRVSITDLFRFPTLSALAAHLSGGQAGAAVTGGAEPAD
ncbi:MAG: MupA/Atu3671 family FMN-dependent luciferase-like monooxygenase, partial [Gemmobacter sp.]